MPVLVDGIYYSDGERCSHCGEPFPTSRGAQRKRKHSICKRCQRRHIDRRYGNRFIFNSRCKACVSTIPEEHSLAL